MKNLEKLVMTWAVVKEERRLGRWDQGVWAASLVKAENGTKTAGCGTIACVAGWAVFADGGVFDKIYAR